MKQVTEKEQPKNTLLSYLAVGEVFTYFFRVFKKNPSNNFNLRVMHGINKISIVMFLFAVIVWTAKRLFS